MRNSKEGKPASGRGMGAGLPFAGKIKARQSGWFCALVLGLAFLFVTPGSVRSAPITWSSATNIMGDTDVITTGSLVYAYSFAAKTNVNTVPFASSPGILGTNMYVSSQVGGDGAAFKSTAAPFAALSGAYRSILIGSAFVDLNGAGYSSVSITLSNLMVGHNYLLQFWVSDPRGPENARSESLSSVGGNQVILNFSIFYGSITAGGPGQYAVGAFTADATSQTFAITYHTSTVVQMNDFQLRDTSIGVPVWDFIRRLPSGVIQLGSHGPTNQTYTILTWTNLNKPYSDWLALTNGTFGTNNVTNTDILTNSNRFYLLRSP